MKFLSFLVLYTLPFITISTSVHSYLSRRKPTFSSTISSSYIQIGYTELSSEKGKKIERFPECEIDQASISVPNDPNLSLRFKSPLSEEQFLMLQQTFVLIDKSTNQFDLPYSYMSEVRCQPSSVLERDLDIYLKDRTKVTFHLVFTQEVLKTFDLKTLFNKKIEHIRKKVPSKIRNILMWLTELKAYKTLLQTISQKNNPNKLTLKKIEKLIMVQETN